MLNNHILNRYDLHCHSVCSDGTNTPKKLLELAKAAGLKGISITDHDTLAAYTENFFFLARSMQIEVLVGVEISSAMDGMNVHILGYDIDLSSQLDNFLEKIRKNKIQRNIQIIQKLKNEQIYISWEGLIAFFSQDIQEPFVLGRSHIAWYLYKKGFVNSLQAAFDQYIGDGMRCYVHGEKFSCQEVIAQIHRAKGKAFLAHPHIIKSKIIINKLFALPFDGVEGYYARLPFHEEQKWINRAKEQKWLYSGGSDYHGEFKPYISLGCSWVDKGNYNKIKTSS